MTICYEAEREGKKVYKFDPVSFFKLYFDKNPIIATIAITMTGFISFFMFNNLPIWTKVVIIFCFCYLLTVVIYYLAKFEIKLNETTRLLKRTNSQEREQIARLWYSHPSFRDTLEPTKDVVSLVNMGILIIEADNISYPGQTDLKHYMFGISREPLYLLRWKPLLRNSILRNFKHYQIIKKTIRANEDKNAKQYLTNTIENLKKHGLPPWIK